MLCSLLGIVINIGGTPTGGPIGGTYWSSPGAFHNGFKGFVSVFVTAAFAYAGTELVGLAAAETANPRKSLPTAIKQVFWRIFLFYIVSLTIVGLLVPYNEPRLRTYIPSSLYPLFVCLGSSRGSRGSSDSRGKEDHPLIRQLLTPILEQSARPTPPTPSPRPSSSPSSPPAPPSSPPS